MVSGNVTKAARRRLTPEDWAGSAYRALARAGVDAIGVEPIAAELGATKGSFYWHFANRESLVEAALDRWERRMTEDVVEDLEREPDPAKRLRRLMSAAFRIKAEDRGAEIAVLGSADDAVRRRVRRVTRRRMAYITAQLEALGWSAAEARDRTELLMDVYLGSLQIANIGAGAPDRRSRQRQVDLVLTLVRFRAA
jgi:AcrR family transcriptional regulator